MDHACGPLQVTPSYYHDLVMIENMYYKTNSAVRTEKPKNIINDIEVNSKYSCDVIHVVGRAMV